MKDSKYKGMTIINNHNGTCTISTIYQISQRYGRITDIIIPDANVETIFYRYYYLVNLPIDQLIGVLLANRQNLPSGILNLLTDLILFQDPTGNNSSLLTQIPITVIRAVLSQYLEHISTILDNIIANSDAYTELNNYNLNLNSDEESNSNSEQIIPENNDEENDSDSEQIITRSNNEEDNFDLEQPMMNHIAPTNYEESNIYTISLRYDDITEIINIATLEINIGTVFNEHHYSDNLCITRFIKMLVVNQPDSPLRMSNLLSDLLLFQDHTCNNFGLLSQIPMTIIKAILTQHSRHITIIADNNGVSNHNSEQTINHVIPVPRWSITNIVIRINIEILGNGYHYVINLPANQLIGILVEHQRNLPSTMPNLLHDLLLIENPINNNFNLLPMPMMISAIPTQSLEYIINPDEHLLLSNYNPNIHSHEQNDNANSEQENNSEENNLNLERIIPENNDNEETNDDNNTPIIDRMLLYGTNPEESNEGNDQERNPASIEQTQQNQAEWLFITQEEQEEQDDDEWVLTPPENNNEESEYNQTNSLSSNDVVGSDFFIINHNCF